MSRNMPTPKPIPGAKKTIAVSSAKGGVGKSTIAANLALALARHQNPAQNSKPLRIGLLDTDIYGPSVPTLLGLSGLEPTLDDRNRLNPLTAFGLSAMSMGFLVPQDKTIAWRGLMVQKALQQLLFETAWPDLDILVLDLPPGTGDVQLTIAQSVELAGAVVVSTPQDLALRDAVRGVEFFAKTNVKVLGMVQNMSTFVCENCGHGNDVFGSQGARRECEERGIRLLGDVPLHASICRDADAGRPTVVADPEGSQAKAFGVLAGEVLQAMEGVGEQD
ncbi:hypothetical protein MBLNU230_g3726t1 [Neophaeotheca triangularis]